MQALDERVRAKNFEEAEKPADTILKVNEAVTPDPGGLSPGVPRETIRPMIATLGPPFLVFQEGVQEVLRLSDEQKSKLKPRLQQIVQTTMRLFHPVGEERPEEREESLHSYKEKAQENLSHFLLTTLREVASQRHPQVMLQREGLFALGNAEIAKELGMTERPRQQFVGVVQDMQKEIEPLLKEARNGSSANEIRPKMMKIRVEHEAELEALLTDDQERPWKELPGKPLKLNDGIHVR
jgi:hypothetical protein